MTVPYDEDFDFSEDLDTSVITLDQVIGEVQEMKDNGLNRVGCVLNLSCLPGYDMETIQSAINIVYEEPVPTVESPLRPVAAPETSQEEVSAPAPVEDHWSPRIDDENDDDDSGEDPDDMEDVIEQIELNAELIRDRLMKLDDTQILGVIGENFMLVRCSVPSASKTKTLDSARILLSDEFVEGEHVRKPIADLMSKTMRNKYTSTRSKLMNAINAYAVPVPVAGVYAIPYSAAPRLAHDIKKSQEVLDEVTQELIDNYQEHIIDWNQQHWGNNFYLVESDLPTIQHIKDKSQIAVEIFRISHNDLSKVEDEASRTFLASIQTEMQTIAKETAESIMVVPRQRLSEALLDLRKKVDDPEKRITSRSFNKVRTAIEGLLSISWIANDDLRAKLNDFMQQTSAGSDVAEDLRTNITLRGSFADAIDEMLNGLTFTEDDASMINDIYAGMGFKDVDLSDKVEVNNGITEQDQGQDLEETTQW